MARYSEWELYEPRSIRKALPLEWAIGHLFNVWGAGSDMLPCPLPGHQDDTPSFNLWAEDSEGFPMRFGCFGCGVNGDVVDAIRLDRKVGFLEACRIAVEELIPEMQKSDWRPSERAVIIERTAPATPGELGAVLDRMPITDGSDLATFMSRKGLGPVGAEYPLVEWEWGTIQKPAPTVYFPHRNAESQLTGIHYRSVRRDGARWAERGSRFPDLYGAWRNHEEPSVLLCEGETDTVWAAWQLRGQPFDVFGLPSGATQKPPLSAKRLLFKRRIYLAFDGDMAGSVATSLWREALQEVAHQVLVVPIPAGEDVLSCGIPVGELLEQASAV